ncbi:MAG: hypothetical protein ACXVEF_41880 [Polyangiales bacterium]
MRSLFSLVGMLAIASATLLPGCSKQGEGQRCDFDPDCEDGLRCLSVGNGSACCPPSGGAGACSEGTVATDSGTATDTATATDSATTETSADSTTAETSTETGATDTGTAADSTTADAADAD